MIRPLRILTGWGKSLGILPKSKAEEKLSKLRLEICKICEMSEESKVLSLVKGHADYIKTLKCTKCKCPCQEKSLVIDEKCPIGKW